MPLEIPASSSNIPSSSAQNNSHAVTMSERVPTNHIRAEVVALLSDMANNCLHELGYYYGMPQELQTYKTKLTEAEAYIFASKQKEAQQMEMHLNNARAILHANPNAEQVFDWQQRVRKLQEENKKLYQDNRVLVATLQNTNEAQAAQVVDQDELSLRQKLQKYRQKSKELETILNQAKLAIQSHLGEIQQKNSELVNLGQKYKQLSDTHNRTLNELRQLHAARPHVQNRRVTSPSHSPFAFSNATQQNSSSPYAPQAIANLAQASPGLPMNALSPVQDTNRDVAAVRRDIPANTPVQLYPSPPTTGVRLPEDTSRAASSASLLSAEPNRYTLTVPANPLKPVQRSVTHPPLPHPRHEVVEVDRASSLPAAVQVTLARLTSTHAQKMPLAPTSYPIIIIPEEQSSSEPTDRIGDIIEGFAPEPPEQPLEAPSADVKMEPPAPDLPSTSITTMLLSPAVETSEPTIQSPSDNAPPQQMATDTTAVASESMDVEMRAADEKDDMSSDEDEPLRLDAQGLRVVEDCLEEIFDEDDDDPDSRVCMLCRNRYQSGAITEEPTIYVKAPKHTLVDHCVAEHPTAWERLRHPS